MAQVHSLPEASKELDELPRRIHERVKSRLRDLAAWPRVSGSKPLRGWLRGRHRLRTGDYWIQFYVHGTEVFVEKIGHRDGFYDG